MFNQRQWEELNAFASAAGHNLQNHGFLTNHQQQHQHQHQHQPGSQPQPQSHPTTTSNPTASTIHHVGDNAHSQLGQFHFEQQPSQDFSFENWGGFGIDSQSSTSMSGMPHGGHSIAAPLQPQPSGTMDWTPSFDSFDDSFAGHAHTHGDAVNSAMQGGMSGLHAVSSGPSSQGFGGAMSNGDNGVDRGVGHLVAQFESKEFNPPLPPRPNNAAASPIAITQQAASHFNHFGPSRHQPDSFASNGFASPGDSMFGSLNVTHSPMTSPIVTSPPPVPYGSYQNGSRLASTSPAAAPTSDPFGSLDGFVGNSQFGHMARSPMAGSPMVGSPAPTTPGAGAPGGTPGFAIWRPPGQQQSQPTSQPQLTPQLESLPQPQVKSEPETQQMQGFDFQFMQHDSQPQQPQQPQPSLQQQPQQQPPPPSSKPPVPPRSRVAASPGGFFRPALPTTPKPAVNVGSQFILELNPGSKGKGKAPAKPARLRAPSTASKSSFNAPSIPEDSVVKQQPSTPSLSEISIATGSIQDNEPATPRLPLGNRPSREQVPPEAWESYKSTIRGLYLEDRKPLKEVMAIMAEKYNFQATPKMYKTRFSQWGFVKNNTEDEVKRLLSMKFQRDSQGKVSEFVRNGKIVNLGTYLKRKGVTEYDLVDFELPADLPSHIRCRTPTPPPTPDYINSPDLVRAQELVVGNMRKAFLQCRQLEVETEAPIRWSSVMIWGVPSSEMLTEANFYFEAQDMDQGGQLLMQAFKQLEEDLRNLTPQGIMEVLLGMVRRETGMMTALCKYVAAFSTTNYERSHPLRQVLTCLYEVQQKHGSATLSELLWGTAPLIAEELEAIYSRRHPYVARTWADLALFYDHKNQERLDKLALELRVLHRQMEQRHGVEASELMSLRYTIAQLHYAADPKSSATKQAASDIWKDMKKANSVYKVRDSRPHSYCYHCPVKVDPWSKRCRRRYDSLVEVLDKRLELKMHFYNEEDFHTPQHEEDALDAWTAAVEQQGQATSRWARFM